MQRGSAKQKKSEIEREQMGQSEKQREIFIILKSYEIRLETDWKEAENPIKKTILCCCFMFLHEKFERKKKTFENTWNMPKASNQMNNDQQQQRKMVFLFGFFEKRENCFFFLPTNRAQSSWPQKNLKIILYFVCDDCVLSTIKRKIYIFPPIQRQLFEAHSPLTFYNCILV